MIGQTISHYKITAKLGEGGMGVVYKAEDTKLERTVALKFLAAHLLQDEEARKRFVREAKAAAALSHPNICTVHEIDEADGRTFIVMAFIEGQSLDQKIEAGPLKLAEAIDIARQTAEGLQEAHAHVIVHRDIKPQNLLVSPRADGQQSVTIMDFGLAFLTEQSKLTQRDTALGTVGYMSPEQTMGGDIDQRTDIWAMGCVLYEMICGQQPFKGHYPQAVTYSILNEEPEPLTGLRTAVPMEIEFIVGKCLAKEPANRYQNASELVVDLRNLNDRLKSGRSTISRKVSRGGAPHGLTMAGIPSAVETIPAGAAIISRRRRVLEGGIFVATALALIFLGLAHFRPRPAELPQATLRRFTITPARPVPPVSVGTGAGHISLSPDGRQLAYVTADHGLWIHDLAQENARQMEGVSEASGPLFWSPDSEFVAFATPGGLRRLSPRQPAPVTICPLTGGYQGGAWSPDGETIVFCVRGEGMFSVAAHGGSPEKILDHAHVEAPSFLPLKDGGKAVLFAEAEGLSRSHDITVLEWKTRKTNRVTSSPYVFPAPSFSNTGHLVFVSDAGGSPAIWAAPMSLASLKLTGPAFPFAEHALSPTLDEGGTLAYVPAQESDEEYGAVWIDRSGKRLGEIGLTTQGNPAIALSPDGRQVAYTTMDRSVPQIWVHDIARGSRTKLTSQPGSEYWPIWSPDGRKLAFYANRKGNGDLFIREADGTGEEIPLPATDRLELVTDWSADGQYLLYTVVSSTTSFDLWYLARRQDANGWESRPFLETPAIKGFAKLSRDGRHVAYISNESGRFEIYVQPFPEGGRRVTISTNGGDYPRWRRDGKELYYVEGNALMAVSVEGGSELRPGVPVKLFENPNLSRVSARFRYDVAADGQRFLIAEKLESDGEPAPRAIKVVENWFAEFRDRKE